MDPDRSVKNAIMMGLADRPGGNMTARLLLALTALYVEKDTHSPEEQQQYAELALRLIERVDDGTRSSVAGILRGHDDAPAAVCARLALVPPITEDTATAVTKPLEASPAELAQSDAASASADAPVAVIAATSDETELEAFFAAPADERRRRLALLPSDSDAAGPAAPAPHEADRLYAALDAAALEGRIGEFIREFGRRLAASRSLCERIVNDPWGEPIVVAARAADMPIAVLQRVLLLVNPAVSHSVQRVYDLTDLYHALDRGAAAALFARWRVAAPADTEAENPPPSERAITGLRDLSSAGLRSRFGALTARVQGESLSSRPDPGSAARRDLRSR